MRESDQRFTRMGPENIEEMLGLRRPDVGFAIVRDGAEIYGGSISLETPLMGGARARLTLPGEHLVERREKGKLGPRCNCASAVVLRCGASAQSRKLRSLVLISHSCPAILAMGFHQDHVVPHLVNLAMRNHLLEPYRERIIGVAEGRVLEVGVGSGLNLPLYTDRAAEVLGLEPHPKLPEMASKRSCRVPVKLIEASAESIPMDTDSVDTVVTTRTLCTIPTS